MTRHKPYQEEPIDEPAPKSVAHRPRHRHRVKRPPKYPKVAKWTWAGIIAGCSMGVTGFVTQMLQYDNIRSWAGLVGMIAAAISAASHLINKVPETTRGSGKAE